MAVTGVGSTSIAQATEASGRANISQEEFLKLLISEITNQNPFEPMSSSEFTTQLTQMQMLQGNETLTQSVKDLLHQQQIASAGSMLGAVVRGTTDSGFPVQGTVTAVSVVGDEVRVVLNGSVTMKLANVQEILLPSEVPQDAGTTDTGTGTGG